MFIKLCGVLCIYIGKYNEIDEAKEEVKQLEKRFDDIVSFAEDDMMQNKVKVRHLRNSVIRLPCHHHDGEEGEEEEEERGGGKGGKKRRPDRDKELKNL